LRCFCHVFCTENSEAEVPWERNLWSGKNGMCALGKCDIPMPFLTELGEPPETDMFCRTALMGKQANTRLFDLTWETSTHKPSIDLVLH
jgi:hypothetical protein